MTFDDKMRASITQHVSELETVLYAAVAVLLIIAASVGVFRSGAALWRGFSLDTTTTTELLALDHLLLVLMLIELLHTVRISIRTQHLTMVPFLIVGLIASIRRVLVITMHAATVAEQGYNATPGQALAFRYSMIELGLAAILILVFVHSIVRLRELSRDAESHQQQK
jgi:uncharacterized membrane protein (DUF373 family)